jgi:hypothetical protein
VVQPQESKPAFSRAGERPISWSWLSAGFLVGFVITFVELLAALGNAYATAGSYFLVVFLSLPYAVFAALAYPFAKRNGLKWFVLGMVISVLIAPLVFLIVVVG